jgi:hypothetical protein
MSVEIELAIVPFDGSAYVRKCIKPLASMADDSEPIIFLESLATVALV